MAKNRRTTKRRSSLARPAPNSAIGSSFRAAGEAIQPRRIARGAGGSKPYKGSLTRANSAIGDSFGAAGKNAFKPVRKVKMGRK